MAPTIHEVPVAVLAGGLATRLGTFAKNQPKALLQVAGRPFIDHQLEFLARSGIRRVVLCIGHLGQHIEAHIGDGARYGLCVQYSWDGAQPCRTGGAIRQALPLLGDLFWVMYGDSYMELDHARILHHFNHCPDALGLMTVIRNDNQWDRSNVVFRDGTLLNYDKSQTSPQMTHIDYGTQLLRRAATARLPAAGPADLAPLYHDLVREGCMAGYEVHQRFYEIGTPAALAEANAWLARHTDRAPPRP